ncbi:MAG: HEAT repeat domain-containing protein [Planctomycetota bacterium]|jgi:flagellar basal body P-ring protein FlgI
MKSCRAIPVLVAILPVTALLVGCSLWDDMTVRSQSPDDYDLGERDVPLVGDLAVPMSMSTFPVKVDSVGLVTGLPGTGSDPVPSPYRDRLLSQMRTLDVEAPNAVLASPTTAMVVVRGVLKPGIQKGDRFDLEVRVLSQSRTTSLRGGYLMETELKEYAVMPDNRIHSGRTWGVAAGPIMVSPSSDSKKDRVLLGRGRVLGGGVAMKSRPLGLEMKPESRSSRVQAAINASRVETAVNRRFHTTSRGVQVRMATAKNDRYVELKVHPRYEDNIQRYMRVVRSIALRETELERQKRLTRLEKQLFDPITTSRAAVQLEAIGHQAVDTLKKAVASEDPEVRFYAAEALAYLDQSDAAEPLAEAARNEPAFRAFALSALSAMDDMAAAEQLRLLLDGESAETRYGAFRALWAMNRNDPMVMGEQLGGQFSYHVLDTSGPAMVHVTRSRRPEIVLFGRGQRLQAPCALEAGNNILVVAHKPGEIAVSRFAVGEMVQKRIVSDNVDEVIREIVNLGGTYPDVVQALQEAKNSKALSSRLTVDALPEAGRTYERVAQEKGAPEEASSPWSQATRPITGLITKLRGT